MAINFMEYKFLNDGELPIDIENLAQCYDSEDVISNKQANEEFSSLLQDLNLKFYSSSDTSFEDFSNGIYDYFQNYLNDETFIILDENNIIDNMIIYITEFIKNCQIKDVDSDFYQLIRISSMCSSVNNTYAAKLSGSLINILTILQTYPQCESKGYLYRLIANCIIQINPGFEYILQKFRIGTVYKDIQGLLRGGNENDIFSALFYLQTFAHFSQITTDESNIFLKIFLEIAPKIKDEFLINILDTFEIVARKCTNKVSFFEHLNQIKILEFLSQFNSRQQIFPHVLPILSYILQNDTANNIDFLAQFNEMLDNLEELDFDDQKFRLIYLKKLASLKAGHLVIENETLYQIVDYLFAILTNLTAYCKIEAVGLLFKVIFLGSPGIIDSLIFDSFYEKFVELCDIPDNSARGHLLITVDYGLVCALNNDNYTQIMDNVDFSEFIDLAKEMADSFDDEAASQAQLFLTRFNLPEEN